MGVVTVLKFAGIVPISNAFIFTIVMENSTYEILLFFYLIVIVLLINMLRP